MKEKEPKTPQQVFVEWLKKNGDMLRHKSFEDFAGLYGGAVNKYIAGDVTPDRETALRGIRSIRKLIRKFNLPDIE